MRFEAHDRWLSGLGQVRGVDLPDHPAIAVRRAGRTQGRTGQSQGAPAWLPVASGSD